MCLLPMSDWSGRLAASSGRCGRDLRLQGYRSVREKGNREDIRAASVAVLHGINGWLFFGRLASV